VPSIRKRRLAYAAGGGGVPKATFGLCLQSEKGSRHTRLIAANNSFTYRHICKADSQPPMGGSFLIPHSSLLICNMGASPLRGVGLSAPIASLRVVTLRNSAAIPCAANCGLFLPNCGYSGLMKHPARPSLRRAVPPAKQTAWKEGIAQEIRHPPNDTEAKTSTSVATKQSSAEASLRTPAGGEAIQSRRGWRELLTSGWVEYLS
jgi:hypothetical protein